MTRNSQRDRIPSGDLTAYERWELPLLDENGRRQPSVEDEERRIKPMTAEELESIHNQAVEEGRREGYEAGKQEGMDQGAREGYRVGYDEGFATGREAGEQKGLEEVQERVDAQQQRLEQFLEALLNPIERQRESTEAALLNLVMAVSRSVIHRELKLNSAQVGEVLRRAVDSLPDPDESIRIHVHPEDADSVRHAVEALERRATVHTDESLHPGGCRVENSHSLVDFTVEKRFQKVVQQMLESQFGDHDQESFGEMDAVMGDMSDFHRDVLEEPVPDSRDDEPSPPDPGEGDDEEPADGSG